ncbi:MAG: tRNA pseudouridine(55) synthase TruB [Alphaproteobacteria bacterium]|nr:tRNA pseudouridine(55) synthase TruB [Alphaproteobacteria bacterium]
MRKRKGLPVSGWVVVDKPTGIGSTSVVGIIRKIFNAQKAGHAGTLDPAASGVLPVALGEATKTIPYVTDGDKIYSFSVKFGEATSTDDAEGTVIKTSDIIPTKEQIKKVIPEFIGKISQVPPKFSAIHVDGKRAYDLARNEVEIKLEPRIIEIKRLELLSGDNDTYNFEVECSKGTYVRSIARDLAEKLGSCGHVVALRRLKCANFLASNAFMLEKLKEMEHNALSNVLLSVETVLDDIPALPITQEQASLLSNGGFLPKPNGLMTKGTHKALFENRLVAIVEVGQDVRPVRVINIINIGDNDVDNS